MTPPKKKNEKKKKKRKTGFKIRPPNKREKRGEEGKYVEKNAQASKIDWKKERKGVRRKKIRKKIHQPSEYCQEESRY